MVGSAVNRAFLPAKSLFEVVGEMMILTARTIVSAVKPPYPYGEEEVGTEAIPDGSGAFNGTGLSALVTVHDPAGTSFFSVSQV